jgi:hypothetical protein
MEGHASIYKNMDSICSVIFPKEKRITKKKIRVVYREMSSLQNPKNLEQRLLKQLFTQTLPSVLLSCSYSISASIQVL